MSRDSSSAGWGQRLFGYFVILVALLTFIWGLTKAEGNFELVGFLVLFVLVGVMNLYTWRHNEHPFVALVRNIKKRFH